MKKFVTISTISVLLFSQALVQVFAQSTAGTSPNTNSAAPSLSLRQQQREQKLTTRQQNLKTRAQNEITRRITSLTNLNNRIASIKHLTDSQKAAMTSGIKTEITNLTALQTKINADTDIQTLRTDVKSIVTSYRVYALYLPEVRINLAADSLLDGGNKLSALATKLQSRITEEQGKGKDVSSLHATLADLQTKVIDSQTQAQKAITAVQGLQPTDYPGNTGTLQAARTQLQTARLDLKTARQDAQKIEQGLRALNKTKGITPVTSSQPTTAPIR